MKYLALALGFIASLFLIRAAWLLAAHGELVDFFGACICGLLLIPLWIFGAYVGGIDDAK